MVKIFDDYFRFFGGMGGVSKIPFRQDFLRQIGLLCHVSSRIFIGGENVPIILPKWLKLGEQQVTKKSLQMIILTAKCTIVSTNLLLVQLEISSAVLHF